MQDEAVPTGAAPTTLCFSDLSIDDTLPPLPRLLLYARSQIALQRLVHVKMLEETCKGIRFDEVSFFGIHIFHS